MLSRRKRGFGLTIRVLLFLGLLVFGFFRFDFGSPVSTRWLKETPIAHRGLHSDVFDENSLGAFSNAIQNGYAIEFDVRLSKDKNLVIFHDNGFSRLLGVQGTIADSTLEEIKRHELPLSNESIPTFEKTLLCVNGEAPLLIEIKDFRVPGELEQKLMIALEGYEGEYAIQSFNPFVCAWFKKHAPNVATGLLLDDIPHLEYKWVRNFKDNLFAFICRPNFIAYNYTTITEEISEGYRNNGLTVLGYSLTDKQVADKSYLDLVDNAIFDLGLE